MSTLTSLLEWKEGYEFLSLSMRKRMCYTVVSSVEKNVKQNQNGTREWRLYVGGMVAAAAGAKVFNVCALKRIEDAIATWNSLWDSRTLPTIIGGKKKNIDWLFDWFREFAKCKSLWDIKHETYYWWEWRMILQASLRREALRGWSMTRRIYWSS